MCSTGIEILVVLYQSVRESEQFFAIFALSGRNTVHASAMQA